MGIIRKPAFWAVAVGAVIVVAVAMCALSIGLVVNPPKPLLPVNIICTVGLTEERETALAGRYPVNGAGELFETGFHVSDNLKSYYYYVELYERGTLVGTYAQSYGSIHDKDGSIVTAFSMNRGESDRWESMQWRSDFRDDGTATVSAIPFPEGFIPGGFATATLTNEGDVEEMPKIVAEQPVIVANIGFDAADSGGISSYTCDYLMDNPEAIAEYECVYIVKCVFSEKDEMELKETGL